MCRNVIVIVEKCFACNSWVLAKIGLNIPKRLLRNIRERMASYLRYRLCFCDALGAIEVAVTRIANAERVKHSTNVCNSLLRVA